MNEECRIKNGEQKSFGRVGKSVALPTVSVAPSGLTAYRQEFHSTRNHSREPICGGRGIPRVRPSTSLRYAQGERFSVTFHFRSC